jgi:LysM repeat protein
MRKKVMLPFLFLSLFAVQVVATGDSTNYLTLKDTIFLTIDQYNQKIFIHEMERHQTLFSLSKFYGLSVEELYYYNPGLKDQIVDVGEKIRIPIPNRAIIRYKDWSMEPGRYVPVFYVVRRGDTMFSICRRLFRMPMDTLLQRHNMTSPTLSIGQQLHIGWMSIDGIPEEYRQYAVDPLTRRNFAMREVYQRTTLGKREYHHQGAAFWKKESKEDSDFYALHRYAPINSVIEVTNPMTNRVVYVKVIGKIPDRAYDRDVVVVLSPLSAKSLGAKDPRFFVRVTYHK